MAARTTVFCSSCGVENQATAHFCSACGAVIAAVSAPASPSGAKASAPAAASPTVVREGIVATGLQRFAYVAASVLGLAALIASFLGIAKVGGLEWGTSDLGYALPAPGYVVGVFIIVILNLIVFRLLVPRRRDVGMAAVRSFRRTLRERDGIRMLLNPNGLRAGIVILALLWIGHAGMAFNNLGNVEDEGFDAALGLYVCLVIPILAVIAVACVWPVKPEVVYMDRDGLITRG
jgi:hypothetical protein